MGMNLFTAVFPVGFALDLASSAVKICDAFKSEDPMVRAMLLKSGVFDGLKSAGTLAALLALYPISAPLAIGLNAAARGTLAALDLRDALSASGGVPFEVLELRQGA